ncbi:MAG: PQQ-binding-like beta-propeller repeat protein [Phycisphaerae bacterium]
MSWIRMMVVVGVMAYAGGAFAQTAAKPSASAFSHPASSPAGGDWPNYRGKNCDLSAPDTGLLRAWPKDGPKVLWRAKIGRGWNQPIVAGDEVFVWGNDPHHNAGPVTRKDGPDDGKGWGTPNKDFLQSLDAKTGQEKWRYSYETKSYKYHDSSFNTCGPHSTPAVSGDKVFVMDCDGMFTCVDRRKGTKVWSRDLWTEYVDEFGIKRNMDGLRGWNQSPLVSGKVVIENIPNGNYTSSKVEGLDGAKCIGMDVETGKTVWDFKEPAVPKGRVHGGDAVLAKFAGQECVVLPAKGMMRALRCADGKELWHFEHKRDSHYIGLLPIGNAFLQQALGGTYLVSIDDRNGDSPATEVWFSRDMAIESAQVSGLVHAGGYIYGFIQKDTALNDPTQPGCKFFGASDLKCFDAKTGKLVWSHRCDGFQIPACLITADGLLFVRGFNTLLLVEATPKGYVEKGRAYPLQTFTNDPPKDIADNARDNGFVPPTLSRGRLYVRGPTELICFDVADKLDVPKPASLPAR